MYEIHVSVTIDADIDRVFDALTDYEAFFHGPKMTCELLREGSEERNGLGATRQVTTDGSVFTEDITAFDRPKHFEYIVRSLVDGKGKPVPMKHERGWLDLTPEGGTTRIDWRSRFSVPIPILGWFVERKVGPGAGKMFESLLLKTKAELEKGGASDSESSSAAVAEAVS